MGDLSKGTGKFSTRTREFSGGTGELRTRAGELRGMPGKLSDVAEKISRWGAELRPSTAEHCEWFWRLAPPAGELLHAGAGHRVAGWKSIAPAAAAARPVHDSREREREVPALVPALTVGEPFHACLNCTRIMTESALICQHFP